jgi:HlyD family secretion protein
MGKKEIFRKVSLERLSSPEQLDMLTRVTNPTGWLTLVVLGAVLLMAIVWGVWGSIPIKVTGQGILLNQGGMFNVVTLGAGQITEVVVQANDYVYRGQVVARIAQPELLNEIYNARSKLAEAKGQDIHLVEFSQKDMRYQIEGIKAQQQILQTSIQSLEKRVDFINQQLTKQQQLLGKGLIIPSRVELTRQDLAATLQQIDSNKIKIEGLRTQEYSLKNRTDNAIKESTFRIRELERNITLLETQLTYNSRVISKESGKVVEVKVSANEVVDRGTPVICLESLGKNLEAVLYLSAADGKKVRPGMEIDIVPSSVKREEYGTLLGLVAYVSDFPTSYQGMVQVLGNEQLAQAFSANTVPYAIKADLIPNGATVSGYMWSSANGPPVTIQAGTSCQGEVIVERKRPINYVIPYLKKKLGL